MKKTVLFFSFFLCYLNFCTAQAGKLDSSFGNYGITATDIGSGTHYSTMGKQIIVQSDTALYFITEIGNISGIIKKHSDGTTDFNYGTNGNSATVPIYIGQAALQSDGKIIVVGHIIIPNQQSNANQLAIARFNTNGSLDETFSEDGIALASSSYNEFASSLALQKDGKIVVAGYTYAVDGFIGPRFLLYRFNTDGSLDDAFSRSGVLEDFHFIDGYNSIALQQDGKIIAAGYQWNGVNYNFVLTRHNTDGSVDSSFPANKSPFNSVGFDRLYKNYIAIQNDGKIIVAGTANNDFALARFTQEGVLDTLITTDFNGQNDIVTAAALRKNGDIVVAGYSQKDTLSYFAIASYTANLYPDTNFSEDGKLTTDFNGNKSFLTAVAIQNNAQVLALGYTMMGSEKYTAIAKFNREGTPDNQFGNNGKLIENSIQGSTKYNNVALQYDGKIITGGTTLNNQNTAFTLARYNTNGKLDESFATGGKQINDFGASHNDLRSIALQTDGKIVAGGLSNNKLILARYYKNGSTDKTFGVNGVQKDSFGISNYINSICLQKDGKILAAGSVLARYNINGSLDTSFNGKGFSTTKFSETDSFNCIAVALQKNGEIVVLGNYNNQPLVAKYLKNGQLDSTFGFNGSTFILGNDHEVGRSLLIEKDEKILVAGYSEYVYRTTTSSFSVTRLNNNGQPDNSFNGGEMMHTPIFYRDYGNSLQIQNDNKIILAGYSYASGREVGTMVRFNTDGTLDQTFNAGGKVITPASGANSRIENIQFFGNNLYAAGYGQYPGNFGVVSKYFLCEHPEILHMKLLNFKGEIKNKKVPLSWQLENEQNLKGFILERSVDSIHFAALNYIAGKGNNQLKMDFSAEDIQPLKGINYYRLKMVETSTAFTYSKLVNVELKEATICVKLFPNPAKNSLLIAATGENEKATIQFINNNGIKIKEVKTTLNSATYIDIKTLSAGIYHLQIITKTGTSIYKFLKE